MVRLRQKVRLNHQAVAVAVAVAVGVEDRQENENAPSPLASTTSTCTADADADADAGKPRAATIVIPGIGDGDGDSNEEQKKQGIVEQQQQQQPPQEEVDVTEEVSESSSSSLDEEDEETIEFATSVACRGEGEETEDTTGKTDNISRTSTSRDEINDNSKKEEQSQRPHRHPHALKKRTSATTLKKQNRQRLVLFVLSSITTFFFVGAALAFGPMQLMLEDNGSFSSKCTEEEQAEGIVCDEQRAMFMRLGLLIPSMQLFSPIIGIVVDKYGPKITAYLQGLCCIVGFLIIITGSSTLQDPLLFVGFAIVAINVWMGSQLILQLGLYFSGHTTSRVIMILNALFDGGAITYIILWFINKNVIQNVSKTLGIYTAIGAVLFALQSYFWSVTVPSSGAASGGHDDAASESVPSSRFSHYENLMSSRNLQHAIQNNISTRFSQRFHTATTTRSTRSLNVSRHGHSGPLQSASFEHDNDINRINPDLSIASAPLPNTKPFPSRKYELKHESTRLTMATAATMDVSGVTSRNDDGTNDNNNGTTACDENSYDNDNDLYLLVSKRSPSAQLRSSPFLLLCIFFAVQVGICNWNTSTQKDFLYELGDDDYKYLSIFTLLTPVSVLGAPFVDYLILNFGWTVALQSINVLAASFLSVKVFSTDLNVQIVGFVLFSFYRSFLFGVSFSFLPSLIAGPVVGRAGGIMTASAGAVGLLLIPLIQLVVGNETVDFFIPNIIILSLCVPTTIVICLLGRFIRLENDYKLVFSPEEDDDVDVV